ncbi:hypothetical protein IT157_05300 [bacterium]|nr:hypothetical protein [bacterium]
MTNHCCYSFADLFRAAFGREPEQTELDQLYALSQDERNRVVKEWAALADWETREVVGTDGVMYVSFGEKSKIEN